MFQSDLKKIVLRRETRLKNLFIHSQMLTRRIRSNDAMRAATLCLQMFKCIQRKKQMKRDDAD